MPVAGKLGRLAPVHDPRTLNLANYLTLPAPPPAVNWAHGLTNFGTMLNDRLGCCTVSAIGHAVQVASVNASQEVTIPDAAILTAYEAVSGYNPATGANDNGAMIRDVLRYWQSVGVAGHKNAAYAACSVQNLGDVKACVALFSFCDIGFNVPQSAMQQFEAGQPWTVVANDGGIIGGHDVIVIGYDADWLYCVTWGAVQRMSYGFWQQYVEEAWGVVLPEWIAQNGQSPSGLNLQALLTDVQQLTQAPDPPAPNPQPPAPKKKTLEDYIGPLREVIAVGSPYDLNEVPDRQFLGAYVDWIVGATDLKPIYQGHATVTFAHHDYPVAPPELRLRRAE